MRGRSPSSAESPPTSPSKDGTSPPQCLDVDACAPAGVPVTFSEFPELAETAEPQSLEIPCGLSGRIDPPGDEDRFSFSVAKGAVCEIVATGARHGSRIDPWIKLQDKDGKELASNDDHGGSTEARLVWTAPDDGTFTVVVGDLTQRGGPEFYYHLTIAPPTPAATASICQPLTETRGRKVRRPENHRHLHPRIPKQTQARRQMPSRRHRGARSQRPRKRRRRHVEAHRPGHRPRSLTAISTRAPRRRIVEGIPRPLFHGLDLRRQRRPSRLPPAPHQFHRQTLAHHHRSTPARTRSRHRHHPHRPKARTVRAIPSRSGSLTIEPPSESRPHPHSVNICTLL